MIPKFKSLKVINEVVRKCFNGSWNRTHVTALHQPGKGRNKNRQRQPPENPTAPIANAPLPTNIGSTPVPQANIAASQPGSDLPNSSNTAPFLDFMLAHCAKSL